MHKLKKINWVFLLIAAILFSTAIHAQDKQTLNLKNADILTLISTVSEITGKNFIIDPKVSGKVTVISNTPLATDELYEVFLSVLKTHGLAAIPSGKIIRIVPDAIAKQDNLPIIENSQSNLKNDQLITQLVVVEHIPAAQLVPILRPLMPQQSHIASHEDSNVLIIADRAGNLERLKKIIERIDKSVDEQIETIPLNNANAAEIVRTLTPLLQDEQQKGKIVADERTNTILLGGKPSERLNIRTLIAHLDTPIDSDSNTQVIYLRYADAEKLIPIIEGLMNNLTSQQDAKTTDKSLKTVQAHPETNSLIVNASPIVFKSIQSIVRQLDIRRAQILVEAIIAEVSLDASDELGIQWQTNIDSIGDQGVIGGTNFGSRGTGTNIFDLSVNPLNAAGGLNLGYLNGTISLPGSETEVLQLGGVLRALASETALNILSTPSIVTLDNSKAVIQVGEEVPFLTGQYSNTGSVNTPNNPFQTIDRKEVGLTLSVTPQINDGDSVLLEIELEVSSLAQSSVDAVDLITNKRTLTTNVLVRDTDILVLGGLIDEDVQETTEKVPLLGDIPLLGGLFKYRKSSKKKRNLMVFLKPTFLKDAATEARISSGKYNFIRSQQMQAQEKASTFTSKEMPLLPELFDDVIVIDEDEK